ncbi:hypothetical protein JCM6882_000692 [Rhodosporidiobolus microsporus]
MPHQQELTDASILSADGLAAFAERRRAEGEGFEGDGEGMSAGGSHYGRGAEGGGYAEDYPPRSTAPVHYQAFFSPSSPPSAPSLSSHPSSSFHTVPSLPLPSPSHLPHPSQPPFPSAPSFPPSSGSTPSYSHGLPAFSRWSPTWYSGSVDGDGRGVTSHAPYYQQAPPDPYFPPPSRVRDSFQDGYEAGDLAGAVSRWEPDDEDEEEYAVGGAGEGGKGEYHLPAGSYLHGVGFDSHGGAPPAPLTTSNDRRRERLERKFGPSPSSPTSASSPSFPSTPKAGFAAAKAARRAQKQDFRSRAGFTHPPDPIPTPSGSAPLIALYLLPFVSLALTLYLHAVRPALHKRRQASAPQMGGAGGMVVPLVQGQQGPGGGGGCCGSRKEKRVPRGMMGMGGGMGGAARGKYQPQLAGGTTVNLVVDPSMFPALAMPKTPEDDEREREKRRRRRRREKKKREKERRRREKGGGAQDEHDDDASLVSSSSLSSLSSSDDSDDPSHSRSNRLLSPLALEPVFLGARSWARKVALVEILAGGVWAGVGVWGIGWGGECKPGSGSGFCDLYNIALAFAILSSLSFFTSATLGFIDLSRFVHSRQLAEEREGKNGIVRKDLLQIFSERKLELLISGLPEVDPGEWRSNTDLVGYSSSDPVVGYFWRAVRSFSHEERAKLLQFVTGSSRVPLEGFKSLQGMNGVTKFSIHKAGGQNSLPTAHTCFHQLDLPNYDSYEQFVKQLRTAITEGSQGFGFA